MANKIKKISVNAFEEAVDRDYEPTTNLEWEGLSIVVKKNLSMNDMLSFTNSVVMSCFEKDSGEYMPQIRDFAIRSCVIEYYTNISLPSNLRRRYDLLYHCNVVDLIIHCVNESQFRELIRAIDQKISNLAQANIEAVTKQVNELYAAMSNMSAQIENVFSGIDSNEINNVISALGSGEFDEEKIVRAIMKEKNKSEDESKEE